MFIGKLYKNIEKRKEYYEIYGLKKKTDFWRCFGLWILGGVLDFIFLVGIVLIIMTIIWLA